MKELSYVAAGPTLIQVRGASIIDVPISLL